MTSLTAFPPATQRVDIGPPSRMGLLTRELPTFFSMHAKAFLARPVPVSTRGQGRKVMLLPGFMAAHDSMALLYRSLAAADFDVVHWGLGRNLGAREDLLDRVDAQVQAFADGTPVALVGWSLGGTIAREYAKLNPHKVRQVITMGSPFSGDIARTTNAAPVYRLVTGHAPQNAPFAAGLAQKPPVPTYALWSHKDSVIAPMASRGFTGEVDESHEMPCAHMGFATCPTTIRTVAELIARD